MAVKQIVTLKGQKDGISIMLDSNADFADIKESLRRKVSQGRSFFDDTGVKVSFRGRELDELGEKILADIIKEETGAEVFVAEEKLPSPAPAPQKSTRRESPTAYYYTGLRSGQRIKYEGSVVIMGDVNPGSEVIADGNVVVLGALKGMAHAGAAGDGSCFVSALLLTPTQLRIAGTISFVPPGAANSAPAYAYVKEGQVFIGPL